MHLSDGNIIKVLDSNSNVWSVIREITNNGDQDEAFYICDMGDVVKKYLNWKKLMPRVETFYAMKCNDHPLVLEVLAAIGSCFDCASKEEITKILDLNVNPNRIIFANPTKAENHIKYAASVKVTWMTFDNEFELDKVKRSHPNAELIIRIKCDDEKARYKFGAKFGCNHITEAPKLLKKAKELGLKVIGVSFHIGSSFSTPSVYCQAIECARYVFDMAKNIGYNFNVLDIGGGFPGAHGSSLKEISKYINESLKTHFPDLSVRVIAEPGRYYCESAFTIATRIHSMDIEPNTDGTSTYMYYVNCGVYNTFINVLFDEVNIPLPLNQSEDSKKYRTILWGPTCDACDKLNDTIDMPRMKIGEWIVYENAGAYSLTLGTKFNGFPIPKTYGVIDHESWKKISL